MSRNITRGWCFTINNYTEHDEHIVFDMAEYAKYVVCGREFGEENGTPHLQGFVYFSTEKSMKQMKEIHPTAHWEPMRGTVDQASEYCKKEGDYFEAGVKPLNQREKGECGKQSIEERWALAKAGQFEQLPPEHLKIYKYIHSLYSEVADRPELDNVWVQGHTGCGKSRWVRETYPVFYTKPMNKWWDGYAGEEVVVLDDFDPRHAEHLSYYLKIWADHYSFNAEVKGGMIRVRPKTVIVTSQYAIEDCFKETAERDAIARRFRVYQIAPLDNPTACASAIAPIFRPLRK